MKQYVNYHSHSIGSLLDGHGKPDVYMKRAKELGMPGLGLSDHGNLHVLLDWYDAGIEAGVKPILGIEAYQARKTRFDRDPDERAGAARNEFDQRGPYHLTIVAKNLAGYKNLLKLSSRAYLEGFFVKPRIDREILQDCAEGLIVLSGCLSGEICQALKRNDYEAALETATTMQDILGKENYYIEIQDHGIQEQQDIKDDLIRLAKQIGAPIIPTCDCHYVHKSDATNHDLLLCINTKATVHEENRFKFHGDEFYLKSYDEMEAIFGPEWLKNTLDINEMIDLKLDFGKLYFPEYPDVPENMGIDEYLDSLVWTGAKKKYGNISTEVEERIEHELRVVKKMDFQEYFLVVSDIVAWAKSQGIRVGWGRGSAAGSILSYCLDITNLDPLKFDLLFERFLIEGRKSPPDIDLDFADRDRVIDYIKTKYGNDKVSHICTFTSIGARSAIRDAARVLGHEYKVGDTLAKMIPEATLGINKSLEESLRLSKELQSAYESDEISRQVIDAAKGIEGVYRHTGVHAAGIVISRGPITDYIPVMQKGQGEPIIAQWDDDRIEQVGLLKIDCLGLTNLQTIELCLQNIKKTKGIDVDVDNIPLDDAETYQQLCKGRSLGAFQIEGSGITDMMVSLQPGSIWDLMALISLYRPGPMGVTDKMFINRKHGREKVTYPHAILSDVLSDTYGIMLYQEDVLNVLRVLAGYDAGRADDIRKVIGKKLMDKVDSYQPEFIRGCRDTNKVDPQVALKIWNDIKKFAGYGFGKAHAASYAMVSFVTAYLKFHYPVEYMTALMSTAEKEKKSLYLNECRKMGLSVQPPSVSRSEYDFSIAGDAEILFGLGSIHGIGKAIVNNILKDRRSYTNLYKFLRYSKPAVLNRGVINDLISSGALDEISIGDIEPNRKTQIDLLEAEKQRLGVYVTDHPLLGILPSIQHQITCEIGSFTPSLAGQTVILGGIITKVTHTVTKRGQKMIKFFFEDMTGDIEGVVFPNDAKFMSDDHLKEGDIVLLTGSVTQDGDAENPIYKLIYKGIEPVDFSKINEDNPIILKVDHLLDFKQLDRLCDIIDSAAGNSRVYIEYPQNNHKIVFQFRKKTKKEFKEKLEQVLALSKE